MKIDFLFGFMLAAFAVALAWVLFWAIPANSRIHAKADEYAESVGCVNLGNLGRDARSLYAFECQGEIVIKRFTRD